MKRTFQPKKRKQSRKHGFFARMKTNIINRRRKKGRKVLSR
ncbi:MAG TPA: 50S ribosomal protein L34 [Mollicutes bacterium]|jgi:large subunit ribosomal protein L34|nr:50S ribosomal protein L34 [Mollicutes bacterium]